MVPCRVLVRDSGGRCHTPARSIVLESGPDRWFMSEGCIRLDVPVDDYELRVERGPEFTRFKSRVVVSESGLDRTIRLGRWINMRERGYLCGENHLHVDTVALGPMAIGEGLDFGSSLTWWNGPDERRPVPVGAGRTRVLRFAGREIVASIFDAELEHSWGAAYVRHLPGPFPFNTVPTRPNLEFLKYAVDHGAIVHYQAGWSREVGVDALLGIVHTVNVCKTISICIVSSPEAATQTCWR